MHNKKKGKAQQKKGKGWEGREGEERVGVSFSFL
jgi:hypothetical protein